MELSVVIPVYNVENYLDACVKSVIATPLTDMEILLVDDGATDSSGRKCDEWAKKDARIRVIHKQNGGLMSAWKCGVSAAKGEYVGFIDSDDWIDADMFPTMLQNIKEHSADIVVSGLIFEYEILSPQKEILSAPSGVYDREKIRADIFPILIHDFSTHKRGLSPSRVTKLFKTSLLVQVLDFCDENISIGEDLLTTFACLTKTDKLVILSDFHPYHYRICQTSIMHKYSPTGYDKTSLLRQALLRVNRELADFDFSLQIQTDYLVLSMLQLDLEMLYANESKKVLFQSMKTLYHSEAFQSAVQCGAVKNLSKKHKFYIFLLKHKLYGVLLRIRKIKKFVE